MPSIALFPGSVGMGERRAWYTLFAHAQIRRNSASLKNHRYCAVISFCLWLYYHSLH